MAGGLNIKPIADVTNSSAQPARLARPNSVPSLESAHSVQEISRYVGQMSAEMASLARSAKLDVLAYFLEMARIEASSIALKTRVD